MLAFISPENTFAAIADILGFLFLLVGVFWVIQAFATREINDLWWFGLIAGILMIILAFWTSGQFFIDKQYVLLVFAGIWALLQGFTDFGKAFIIRQGRPGRLSAWSSGSLHPPSAASDRGILEGILGQMTDLYPPGSSTVPSIRGITRPPTRGRPSSISVSSTLGRPISSPWEITRRSHPRRSAR